MALEGPEGRPPARWPPSNAASEARAPANTKWRKFKTFKHLIFVKRENLTTVKKKALGLFSSVCKTRFGLHKIVDCTQWIACLWSRPYVVFVTGNLLRVSLEQAIVIHAKALKYRFGSHAPMSAREKAQSCAAANDHEGHRVWIWVAEAVELLFRETAGNGSTRGYSPRGMSHR